ncbi:hypothetical protein [Runella sp.]|uniref:hypothetical protein n=1 Tax=Runella sp. TaxID=1960881 RepID=UPI0030170235
MKPTFPNILMLDCCSNPTELVGLLQLFLPGHSLWSSCVNPDTLAGLPQLQNANKWVFTQLAL